MEPDLIAEVQGLPEVPAVAHFCSLFHTTLGLAEFDINQLEAALVNCRRRRRKPPNSGDIGDADEAADARDFLNELCVKLLRGSLPHQASRIQKHNYLTYARQLIVSRAEELEEDSGCAIVPPANPFDDEEEAEALADMSPANVVHLLRLLTDFRLEAEDIPELLKNMDADSLRVEPLGTDSAGRVYWYFYGTRLYMEVATRRRQQKKPKKINVEGTEKGKKTKGKYKEKDSKKKAKQNERLEENEVSDEEEKAIEPPGWYLCCRTEADWQRLSDRLRGSRKKPDRELYTTLETNFLPEIARMFAAHEREERLRLLMANKRSSSRIDRRRQEAEERQLREQQLDEQLAAAQRLEEARRAEQEKENAMRMRTARLAARGCGGDVAKIDIDGGGDGSMVEDREERKRRREAQQDVLRKRQEIAMDHDYLAPKARKNYRFY